MKQFEAIEEEIKNLEDLNSSVYSQLLSELKQITDEHSEMVDMLKDLLESWEEGNFENEQFVYVKQLLTKINDK